jgi:hypothetical protein
VIVDLVYGAPAGPQNVMRPPHARSDLPRCRGIG